MKTEAGTMSKEKYCYSTDGEYFTGEYDTPQSAAENAFNDIADIDQVEIGRIVRKTAHDFVSDWSIESFFNYVQGEAGDECGECADDWLEGLLKDQTKMNDLRTLVGDWIEKNDPVKFWAVDDIVQTTREEVTEGRFVCDGF